MAVKRLNPVTAGTRFAIRNAFTQLTTDEPEKSLMAPLKKSGGRNNKGRMTVRQRGGGHKRQYRIIDFIRDKDQIQGTVKTVEYDPNRSAFIALVTYADGEKRYIIAPEGIQVGQQIVSGDSVPPELGNTMQLKYIPLGTIIHNIEMKPGRGGVMARSAGSYAQLLARDGERAILKLPSGESRMVPANCRATIGTVSNADHTLVISGKAGRSRWLGRRPRVRGVAMNPVDHPMGGGEGRASGGHPRSRTGLYSKGEKTRARKKASNKYIIERRKKRR